MCLTKLFDGVFGLAGSTTREQFGTTRAVDSSRAKSFDGAAVEVRVFDDAEAIAERVGDRSDADAVADLGDRIERRCAESDQSRERSVRVGHAP